MTKQDFEAIARAVAGCATGDEFEEAMRRDVATALAAELAAGNPRFDRARFLKACGVEA